MKWIFLISTAVLSYCIVQIVAAAFLKNRIKTEERLNEIRFDLIEKDLQKKNKKRLVDLSFLRISQSMKDDISLSGIKMNPEEFVLLWIFLIFGPASLNYTFTNTALRSALLILLGTVIPPVFIKIAIKRQHTLFERQLGDALMVLSNGLRAGFSFPQAMANIARDLSDPIGKEFKTVDRELQLGVDIETALTKVAERMDSSDLKLLTTAVVVQQQVGGNLSDILDIISKTIRDRLAVKRQIKTLTAQGKISGQIIGCLPVGIMVIISVINPSYMMPLFNTFLGWMLLGIGFIMECIGFFVIYKIVDIKF